MHEGHKERIIYYLTFEKASCTISNYIVCSCYGMTRYILLIFFQQSKHFAIQLVSIPVCILHISPP